VNLPQNGRKRKGEGLDCFGIILNCIVVSFLYVVGPVGGIITASRDLDPTYRIFRKLGIQELETNISLRIAEKLFRMGTMLVGFLELSRLLVLWLIVVLLTPRLMKSCIQSINLSDNNGIDGQMQTRRAELAKYNCLKLIAKTSAPVLSLPIAAMMLCLGNVLILGIFRLIRLRSFHPSALFAINQVFLAGVLAGMLLAIGTAVECKEASKKMLEQMWRKCNKMKRMGRTKWQYKMAKSLKPIEWHFGTGIWGDFVFGRIDKRVKSGYFYWVWDRTIAALLLVV
jgi:hypothetical protein